MTSDDTQQPTDSGQTETRELTVSRVIDAPPERVYEAFTDPAELGEWMHPPGVTAEVHHMEAEEGGTYEITMRKGSDYAQTYTGEFVELVPGDRIVQRESFDEDAGGMPGEMTVTSTFEEVEGGTEVTVTIEIPADWPDDAVGGWAAALENLAERLGDD